ILDSLLVFGRLLRQAGIDVHAGRMIDLVDALGHVDLARRDDVYFTCRALLVHRQDQLALFDAAFGAFWRLREGERHGTAARRDAAAEERETAIAFGDALPSGEPDRDEPESEESSERRLRTWSDRAGLAEKEFAAFTPEELAAAHAALS